MKILFFMSKSITEPFSRVRMLLRKLHHLKQVILTKLAPRGAFLVCSSPVPHEQIIFCLNSVIPISAIPINIIFIKSHAQFVQFLP